MARRDISDCKTHAELLELWHERAARVRALRDGWKETEADLRRLTRPPRDPDERAFLEEHGGLGPFSEKPNPPWAKGWPPRNPDRPLTEREKFADAVNAVWREEPLEGDVEGDRSDPPADDPGSGPAAAL